MRTHSNKLEQIKSRRGTQSITSNTRSPDIDLAQNPLNSTMPTLTVIPFANKTSTNFDIKIEDNIDEVYLPNKAAKLMINQHANGLT